MSPKDFSLVTATHIAGLLRSVRKTHLENSDIIEIVEKEEALIFLSEKDGDFFFQISNPTQLSNDLDKTIFDVSMRPTNERQKKVWSSNAEYSHLLSVLLPFWIELLKKYNQISFEEEDYIAKAYEEEFYAEYEIVDEDADIKPFSAIQQEKLDLFFTKLIENLEREKANYLVAPIIEKVQAIKRELPTSTKKKVVKALGKVWAEMKKQGVEAVKKFTAGKAEDLLRLGFEIAVQYIKHH